MAGNSDLFNDLSNYLQVNQQAQDTAPIRQAAALATIPANGPQTSQAEAALRNGIDGATFGFGDSVKAGLSTAAKIVQGQSADYATEEAAQRARTKLSAEEWPKTAATAGLAGSLATMALPGVGEAKAASALTTIVGGALRGAAASGLTGVGHGKGNVSDRLQSGIEPALLGGAAGGVLGTVGAGISRLLNPEKAGEQVVKSLGNNPAAIKGLQETFKDQGGLATAGRVLQGEGYVGVGRPIQVIAAHLDRDLKTTGENIGGLLAAADSDLGGASVDAESILKNVNKALQAASKKNPGIANEIADAAKPSIKNYIGQFLEPALAQKLPPKISLSDLQAFRTTLAGAYETRSPAVSEALQTVERTVQNEIKKHLSEVHPEAGKALATLDENYNFLSNAHKLAKTGVSQAEARANSVAAGSLGAGLTGAATNLAFGNIPGAGASLAAGGIGAALAPQIASTAMPTLAAGRNALSNTLGPVAQGAGSAATSAIPAGLAELFRQGN